MAEPFLGEIRMMLVFSFSAQSWTTKATARSRSTRTRRCSRCSAPPIGGDGQTTFGLPDLRGRIPIHVGQGHTLGEVGGEQAHTLSTAELSAHVHLLKGSSTAAELNVATGAYLGLIANGYTGPSNLVTMSPSEIGSTGGSQGPYHQQPFLTISFCIALQGIFPSQN